jgi:hypothetical protein
MLGILTIPHTKCLRHPVEGEIMPTANSILDALKKKGSEKTRAIYARHGMAGKPIFGVSIADLKVVAKTIKGQQALARELYETGNLDAMYLAGMVADGSQMTANQLTAWAEGAAGLQMISEYTVTWVALQMRKVASWRRDGWPRRRSTWPPRVGPRTADSSRSRPTRTWILRKSRAFSIQWLRESAVLRTVCDTP